MKRLLTLILFLVSYINYAQTYTISNWYNDKESATVLTFDDWDPSSPGSSLPIMLSKEVAGTYFVTINNAWRTTDYPTMTNAASLGIEIANHTVSHPDLTATAGYVNEIENCRTTLNMNVTQDLPVHTFAYPFGDYNSTVIAEVKKHHVGARAVSYTTNEWGYNYPSTNDEYFTIPTIQVGTMGTLNDFIDELENAIEGGGLYTIMYHSVGGLGWFDDIPTSLFEDQLDEVKAREHQTWVTTFSNAVRYHKEKHCASLNTLSNDQNTWTLNLTDTLSNNAIFNHALSIHLTIPIGETYSSVQQNGEDLTYSISNGGSTLSFNAIPDGGDIVLTKNPMATNLLEATINTIEVFPIPSSHAISIKTSENIHINAIQISTMQGQIVYSINHPENQPIDISGLTSGVYLLEMTTDQTERIIKRIIKN